MATQVALNLDVISSVASWQHILNGCGYNPVLKITGIMDEATIATTQKFQTDLRLEPTGEVDLNTWQAGLKHPKLPDWQELPIPPIESELPELDSNIPQCAIDLIKEFEGYHKQLKDGTDRVKAYPDPGHGWKVPTIGYGTIKYPNGEKVKEGDIITREQAEAYLLWEVEEKCKHQLEKIPTWSRMNANQRGALYSFAYNLGAGFYKGANFQSITKVCDSPEQWNDESFIHEQFMKYVRSNGVVLEGLKRRRAAEAKLFCTPLR